jgi:hypothetical protein
MRTARCIEFFKMEDGSAAGHYNQGQRVFLTCEEAFEWMNASVMNRG